MAELRYDPERIAEVFDRYGEREWDRHEETARDRGAFEVRRRLLGRFVREGDRVLEVGAGPGRLTVELARLGARVVVGDVSPTQLELNRRFVGEAGLEGAVESRSTVDVIDLSGFEDSSFDSVVCLGGPLSYVLERFGDAVDELLRVTRPGGVVVADVMSKWGSLRVFLPGAAEDIRNNGLDAFERVLSTGDLPQSMSSTGPLHMYTWDELVSAIGERKCEVVARSAAGFLTSDHEEFLDPLREQDPALWSRVLDWDGTASAASGAVEAGTHIVFVLRRT